MNATLRVTPLLLAVAILAAFLGVFFGAPAAAVAANPPAVGGLVPDGCIAATTTSGCGVESLLAGATAIALSPTGNAVYVIAEGEGNVIPDEVLSYARDVQTGAIGSLLSCWGYAPQCGDDESGLYGLGSSIAVGPDDAGVYVVSGSGGSESQVIALSTSPSTGAITGVLGCYYDPSSTCSASKQKAEVGGLRVPTSVAVSPDGDYVYVASKSPGGVAAFRRDATTGALTGEVDCFIGQATSTAPDSGCVNHATGDGLLFDSQSIAVGSSGVYVLTMDGDNGYGAIMDFPRNASTGAMSDSVGTTCWTGASSSAFGCSSASSLAAGGPGGDSFANALAIDPNGSGVYADASNSTKGDEIDGSLTSFGLDASGDLATNLGCLGDDVPGCPQSNGISTPEGLAVSPDGADLYVAGSDEQGGGYLDGLAINAGTGAATAPPLSCAEDPGGIFSSCASAPGLTGAYGVAVSPDGHFVYTAGSDDGGSGGALSTFSRTVAPTCSATAAATTSSTPVPVTLSCADANGNPISYSIVSGPSNGTLGAAGVSVTYTPNANFVGHDSFTYRASDGTNSSESATAAITVSAPATTGGASVTGNSSPPHSTIKRLPASVSPKKLRRISGSATAGAGAGVAKVQIGILSVSGGAHAAHAAAMCRYLAGNGHLTTVAAKKKACPAAHFLTAKGTTSWSFTLRRALPAGHYIVFSRAIASGGALEAVHLAGAASNVARVHIT